MRYAHIFMHGKLLGSQKSRTASSSIVFVTLNQLFGFSSPMTERAACIDWFCKHTTVVNGKNKLHLLAHLSWYKMHPKHSNFGKPVYVWYHDLFEDCGIYSLIPVQFIKCRSVALIDKLDGESVLFTTPVIDF